jgi:integrase
MAQTADIRVRHSRKCATNSGGNCNCTPSVQARVWIPQDKKRRVQTFTGIGARAEAKNWLTDARKGAKDGKLRAPSRQTLREAVDEFLTGAETGAIRKRDGGTYKPSVLRQYRSALDKHVLPTLGDRRLDSITFSELRDLQEQLQERLSGSTVRNAFVPLQTIFKRAKRAGVIAIKPTEDLELPSSGTRDRAATPAEAAALIDALPEADRALWAAAFYGGLRRGELRALRVSDIQESFIDVSRGWDDRVGAIEPKSKAGVRRVPLLGTLRPYLDAQIARTGRSGEDLLFGATATMPFMPREVSDRADAAWKDAKLERFTMHEARHSFSTWLDATAVTPDRADRYLGHSRGTVQGRYRHLLPGQLAEDAKRVDAYLAGATSGKVVTLQAAG